jgi:hypothetical protein
MTEEPMPENTELTEARSRARKVYETLERRLLARTWKLPEPALGFTNDAASPRTAD